MGYHNSVTTVLPLVIVAGTALAVFLVDMIVARKAVLAWVATAGLLAAAAVAVGPWLNLAHGVRFNGRQPAAGFNHMVALDKYALFFTALFCGVGILSVMLSDAYLTEHGGGLGEFYGLLLLVISGMIGMAVSTDLIAFFVSFELMSLPTYVLAGYLRSDVRSGEASMKYFVNGAFASAILAFGLALLYGVAGQTGYHSIDAAIAAHSAGGNPMLIVAFVLIATGFGFKISAVPFHSWAPDVYEGAPTPVTAFMSVGVKAGAFAGFLRLLLYAGGLSSAVWTDMLIILAVATMVIGNVLALPQRNLKRMLAYSSIAHAGYLLLGVIAAGRLSSSGGAGAVSFYLAAYALMNLGAFGLLVWVRNRRRFGYTLDEVAGLGRTMPATALAMALFMLSLTGIPPTAGFWGKFYLFTAVVDANLTWLAVIAVIMSAVSAFYYLRVVWYIYFREAPDDAVIEPQRAGTSYGVSSAMVIVSLGVLAVGVYPTPLIHAAQGAMRLVLGG